MINIIIKDYVNKLMQEFHHLKEETELLINDNKNKINMKDYHLSVETLTDGTTKYWINQGYKIDNSLYDRLIIEYNQNNLDLLTR
ncbi:MAG: hypothetical protein DRJ05_15625 [Bacteroidetes bacterium]|nr:MAG: hypothetical protein DRJ05_15625 [Bacteroidota bacterium]